MIRARRSITINSYTVEHETLAIIGHITREFENVGDSWRGVDIDFSIQNRRREPYAIPKEITNALVRLFQTIENTRSRIFDETMDILDDSRCGGSAVKHDDKLFLQIGPTICDDENFRAMIGAAIKTMILKDIKVHEYGNFHPKGTIANSLVQLTNEERQQQPSLWDFVASSSSLENIHISVLGLDQDSDINNSVPFEGHRLPCPWEAIRRNKSLSSLEVHLYCQLCEQQEDEKRLSTIQRLDTLSTMKFLSESLRGHSSIRKLNLRYRRDVHQRTLLVPHATEILESATLHEFKIERFSFYVDNDELGFPMNEFNEALSKCNTNRRVDIDSDHLENSQQQLEVLEFSNVGITDIQANKLLQCLPNSIKVLDLSKNRLVDFPVVIKNHNSSQLTELVLWKNPCLCNRDQEASLRRILSLLEKYPCLKDLGPWDKCQFQRRVDYPYLKLEVSPSLRNVVDRVHDTADKNRCQIRSLPSHSLLLANLSLWPLFLSQTRNLLALQSKRQRRKLLEFSSKSIEERQASVIFAFLRESVSGGVFTRVPTTNVKTISSERNHSAWKVFKSAFETAIHSDRNNQNRGTRH